MSDQKNKIKQFIVDNFLFGNANGLSGETSFLEEGIIDSTGVLELVNYLEAEYSIQITDDELIPENLDSIDNIWDYIQRKTNDNISAAG